MPIYVYERPDGSRFEIRQGFNDESLTTDPETGVPVRRILQPAPVIFKGSGWYKTDSRASATSSTTEAKAPDAAAPTSSEKGDGAATETKSAKEAVSEATAKTTAEIKKTAEKPATPAAAS
jgi:predicted nucleic acid-binding Zn ribbon protein